MGANASKTSFERRNTITRRSQRRSIHNIRSKVDKVFIEAKRFDGVEEDEKFRKLMFQMDHLRNDLLKKQRELQPQVRRYFQTTLNRLDDAEEALEDQLEDNREYFKERQEELQERARLRQEMLESPKTDEVDKKKMNEEMKRGIFKKRKEKVKNESDEEEEEENEDAEDVEPDSKSNRNTNNLDESDNESDKDTETKYKRRDQNQQNDSEEERESGSLQYISKKNNLTSSQSEEDPVKVKSLKCRKNGRVRRVYNDINIEEDGVTEADKLSKSTSKRKTVELNFVKIIPQEREEPEVQPKTEKTDKKIKSPDEKRKSILKMGIPVMPAAMMNFITKKSKKASVKYNDDKPENNNEDIVKRVNTMINELQTLERQIADFVGKKYGTQYNRIRDKLNHHLVELCQMKTSDEFELEQIKMCRNYVSSCMNFLDDKAVEVRKQEYEDDVFLPRSGSSSRPTSPVVRATSPIHVQDKLQKLSKTTAI